MQQNKTLIKRCAAIRAERQDVKNIKRFNRNLNSVNYKPDYKVIDMTGFPTAQFLEVSRAIKDGYALKRGDLAERMTVSTNPRVTSFIKDECGDSGYTLIGKKPSNFKPTEGKTTLIDLYSDSDGCGNWFYFQQLHIWLIGSYGFVVTMITPPGVDVTWADVLDNPKQGPDTLIEARKNALDFSHYWDEAIFE